MDHLLQILFWCPRCWRSIGRLMFIAGTILALTGWRLSRRVERVEDRSGINIDLSQIVDAIPESINCSPHAVSLYSVIGGALLDIGIHPINFQQARKKRLGREA